MKGNLCQAKNVVCNLHCPWCQAEVAVMENQKRDLDSGTDVMAPQVTNLGRQNDLSNK